VSRIRGFYPINNGCWVFGIIASNAFYALNQVSLSLSRELTSITLSPSFGGQ